MKCMAGAFMCNKTVVQKVIGSSPGQVETQGFVSSVWVRLETPISPSQNPFRIQQISYLMGLDAILYVTVHSPKAVDSKLSWVKLSKYGVRFHAVLI